MPAETKFDQRVKIVRGFNRFYTKQIGVLQEGLLGSEFSLAESRVLYELAHQPNMTASELTKRLSLDPGYLSRILRKFQTRGLLVRQPSPTDGRQTHLALTEQGQTIFHPLNVGAHAEIAEWLSTLTPAEQKQLIAAMQTIERLLDAKPATSTPYLLRPHQPGDMGWVVQRHGLLYAQEYGWDEQFEALVAEIVAKFIKQFDPKRERCWMAEKDGEVVGSVFLVKETDAVAKLRLLIVEPRARGLGIGRRLVQECERFARQVGYQKITLWTNSVLVSARHIYETTGYQLVHAEPHHSFGHDLVGETWELVL